MNLAIPERQLFNSIIVSCDPMGAVRMTQRGKWMSETAQRYMSYKTAIGLALRKQWSAPTDAACSVRIIFHMPIPKSHSRVMKKRLKGTLHTKKPDIDNLIKGVFDAATGIIWRDDNQVVKVEAEKRYSDNPRIEMTVTECF